MVQTQVTIEPGQHKKFIVSFAMDADALERLAGQMGWFSPEFLSALEEGEKDFRSGRYTKIQSSRELDEELL